MHIKWKSVYECPWDLIISIQWSPEHRRNTREGKKVKGNFEKLHTCTIPSKKFFKKKNPTSQCCCVKSILSWNMQIMHKVKILSNFSKLLLVKEFFHSTFQLILLKVKSRLFENISDLSILQN